MRHVSEQHGISLREVLPAAEFLGADDIRVASCACDACGVRPGDLFVLLPDVQDAEQAVLTATQRGAAALLSPRSYAGFTLPTCVAADSDAAFGRVCQALAGDPSQHVKLVGIAGAWGATAATLTASVLAMGGYASGANTALGCHDGIEWRSSAVPRPSPLVWADWLERVAANGCSHAVLEASQRTLGGSSLAGITLDVAGITNSGPAEGRRLAPAGSAGGAERILEHLTPEGVALFNADDPGCVGLLERWEGPALSFGIDAPAEISASIVEQDLSEQTFLLDIGHETVPVRTQLVGRANIEQCLAAAAVGVVYGIEPEVIARGLEAVSSIPWRLERLVCGQPFGVFLDAAATPAELAVAQAVLRPLTRGRLICVNLTGRRDGPAAIRWALDEALPGDCVLIVDPRGRDAAWEADDSNGFDAREFACRCLYDTARQPFPYRISA